MQKLFNKEQEAHIIALYQTGLSTLKLSKQYNCSPGAINNVLKRNNVQLKSNKEYRRLYSLDHDFFENIDTEEKAYWLGFLYADGNVRITKSGQHMIQLKVNDREVIEKFLKSIKSNMPIGEYKNYNNKYIFGAHITSDKMFADLCKHGCVPNKSLILTFPVITEELIPHFIRGYFDGDGGITIRKLTWNRKRTGETITKEEVKIYFNGTKEMLDGINSNFYIGTVCKEKRRPSSNTWYVQSDKVEKTKSFYEYLYKNATIYLSRKKNKFDNFYKKNVQRL